MKWNRITSEEAISALGVNAKPHLIKRLFAGLIDVVILFFCQVLLYALLAMTPVATYVNKYSNKIITLQEEYKVAAGYALEEQVESTYNGKSILHYNNITMKKVNIITSSTKSILVRIPKPKIPRIKPMLNYSIIVIIMKI